MAYKPEIQYIGQFYVYGSEAKELAPKAEPKKEKFNLPLPKLEAIHRIYVDPMALCALATAVVMFVVILMGALQLQTAWAQFHTAKSYVSELKQENRILQNTYRSGYDLEEVKSAALSMGLVPASQVKTLSVKVTVPEPQAEPTLWDDICWFVDGLFE